MELDVDFIDIDTCEPVPVSRSFRLLSSSLSAIIY